LISCLLRRVRYSIPLISFIIPAHNEERLIARTLSALHDAARTVGVLYEVIVADDGSTDATRMIAAAHGARVVPLAARQIAAARNAGARAARGEWLVFVDADTTVTAEVVRSAAETLRNGAVGGGATVQIEGSIPRPFKLLAWTVPRILRARGLAAGCFLFCTRKAFEAAGGFDERFFAAEELVLSRALKRAGRFVVLRDVVVTSGRKLRTHSGSDLLRLCVLALRHGRQLLRTREGLAIWYGPRRDDPELAILEPRPAVRDQ
jgi:glycosyltransferase involved in cell wall biosynthesis